MTHQPWRPLATRPFIAFMAQPSYEQIQVGSAPILTLDLSRVPRGELRELARKGFRTLVHERCGPAVARRDTRHAFTQISHLIRQIERQPGDDE